MIKLKFTYDSQESLLAAVRKALLPANVRAGQAPGPGQTSAADLGMNIKCQPDSLLLRSFLEISEALKLNQDAEAAGKITRDLSSEFS